MIVWAPECLATFCLLRQVRVPSLHIEYVRNAAEMSNYGSQKRGMIDRSFCLFVLTLNNRVFSEFDEIANLIELKGLLNGEIGDNSTIDSFSILSTDGIGSLMVRHEFDEIDCCQIEKSFF